MNPKEIPTLIAEGMLTVTGGVYFLLKENPGLTKKDLQTALGGRKASINCALKKLKQQGRIDSYRVHQSHYSVK